MQGALQFKFPSLKNSVLLDLMSQLVGRSIATHYHDGGAGRQTDKRHSKLPVSCGQDGWLSACH